MIIKRILVILFVFSEISMFGKQIKDTTKVESFADKLTIKFNIDTQNSAFSLYDASTEKLYRLKTNERSRLALSFDYDFVGFSIGYAPKFLIENDDDDLKGKSSLIEYDLRLFLGKWVQEVSFLKSKGYYLENTKDFLTDWEEGIDAYIKFPNLKFKQWTGKTSYVFNPNFSLKSLTSQTEWQKKSAGSFIPKFGYTYSSLFDENEELESKEHFFDLHLEASYYYTFVIRENWHISPSISLGYGIRFSKKELISSELNRSIERSQDLVQKIAGGLRFGYNSRKIIFGLSVNFDSNFYQKEENIHASNDMAYSKLYLGYRFDAPRIIKKPIKWVKNSLKL